MEDRREEEKPDFIKPALLLMAVGLLVAYYVAANDITVGPDWLRAPLW